MTILHVGPSIHDVGGISTVIDTLTTYGIGGPSVAVGSWTAGRLGKQRSIARSHLLMRRCPPDVVHLHVSQGGSVVRKLSLAITARANGHAVVMTLHGSRFNDFARKHPHTTRQLLRRADQVLVLSLDTRAIVRELAPHTAVRMVHNPIAPAATPTALPAEPSLLFAGEIGVRKGADILHAAWPTVRAAVPNAVVDVIGPPTNLFLPDLPGFRIHEATSSAEIRLALDRTQLAILPSRSEQMPMFVLEALAAGRPFVSTTVGSLPQLAAGGAGVLVHPGKPSELATAVVELLTDRPRIQKMSERATATAAVYDRASLDAVLAAVYAAARDSARSRSVGQGAA